MTPPPVTRVAWRNTCRLIPTRYPSIGVFDRVASSADLAALVELEAWTNDRLNAELGVLPIVPQSEWTMGKPMATVVMAAFCHPRPGGSRFSGPERGAWYSGRTLATAIAESVYHRATELAEVGGYETRMQMRVYRADFRASFHDIRGRDASWAHLYDPDSYVASQSFGRDLLAAGGNGLLYRSVRDRAGENIVCFRPRLVLNVRVAAHYEFRWEGSPTPRVITLH